MAGLRRRHDVVYGRFGNFGKNQRRKYPQARELLNEKITRRGKTREGEMKPRITIKTLDSGYYRITGPGGAWAQVSQIPCSAEIVQMSTFDPQWHGKFIDDVSFLMEKIRRGESAINDFIEP
jgi:hypothetical protein